MRIEQINAHIGEVKEENIYSNLIRISWLSQKASNIAMIFPLKETNTEFFSGDMAALVERSILLHSGSATENLESFGLCSLHCHLFLHLLPLQQVPPRQLSLSHCPCVLMCSKSMSAPTAKTYFYTK